MSIATLCNRNVTIERKSYSADGWGADSLSYSAVGTARARVQPVSGADAIVAGRPDQRITHRVYFAGTPDVRAEDRINDAGDLLYVTAIRDIDKLGRLLTVDCEQRNLTTA